MKLNPKKLYSFTSMSIKSMLLPIMIVATIVGNTSCNSTDPFNTSNNVIYLKVKSALPNEKDSTIYVSTDFQLYNATSKELMFVTPPTVQKLQSYGAIKFFIGVDSLFTATIALDNMSSIKNDLVLHFNSTNGKLYLEDGYPMSITNTMDLTIRAQNREKRAAAWSKFIIQLKKDKHYSEQ